jgi:hypothetical protein
MCIWPEVTQDASVAHISVLEFPFKIFRWVPSTGVLEVHTATQKSGYISQNKAEISHKYIFFKINPFILNAGEISIKAFLICLPKQYFKWSSFASS